MPEFLNLKIKNIFLIDPVNDSNRKFGSEKCWFHVL